MNRRIEKKKKKQEKKQVYAIMEAQVHSVRPSSIRQGISCAVRVLGMHFVSASPEPNPRVSRHLGASL